MIRIKILVADDNPLTLQSLQTTLPWKEWGYELTACAKNGNEAWEKISRYHPDIVILDIHMPGMSGLEVASLIQNLQEKPVVILLSAYDEFTYAKKGIRLGVFDYLLKPLDNGELKMVLDKAAQFLEKESHRNNQTWRKDWCEKLLMEGLSGGLDAAQTLGAYLSEQWHPYGYSLILLQRQEGSRKDFEAFRTEISDILRNEPVQHLIVEVKDGSVVLLGFTSLRLVRDYDLEALYFAGQIVERAKACALRLFAGISNYTEKPERLENMYEEAKFAAESRFFLENKSVIHYQSVMSRSVHNEYLMSRKMQEIFLALSQKNVDGFLDFLDAFIELLQQDKRYDTEYVRTIFSQIAFSVSSMLDNCSMGDEQIKTINEIQDEIQKISSLQDMVKWIREYARTCAEHLQKKELPISIQTKRALDFLNTNYMKQLSLGDAASSIGVSESHLCRLLKNETGETFVNILSKIRIQKAKQLIESGKYKVYEVAEMVGIANYAYFYQVFRKITGVSPTEYQKDHEKAK